MRGGEADPAPTVNPAVFVFPAETAALAILLDPKGSGIELIKDEYHLHLEDPGVAEALCLLVNEMVQYGEMAAAATFESLPLSHPQNQ